MSRRWLVTLALSSVATTACSGGNSPDALREAETAGASGGAARPTIVDTSMADVSGVPQRDSLRGSDRSATGAISGRAGDALPGGTGVATTEAAKRPSVGSASERPRRVVLGDVDLTGIGYDRGSVTAPVVMIDFSDFSCPFCGKFSLETYPTIERDYVKTGKVFFKYVPFVMGNFPNSREAARASECAADQGGFWPMMNLVYEGQREWRGSRNPYPLLSAIASVAGLDTARLGACYASKRTDARTARVSGLVADLGVRVTPSFLVDERPIQGALPLADFRRVLDAALLVRGMNK